jgi:hypothetical protein
MKAEATAGGKLQLLTAAQASTLVLDAPDPMAVARFTVPMDHPEQSWEMEGPFRSGETDMGQVSVRHWYTNPVPSTIGNLLKPRLVFWTVIAIGAIWLLNTLRWRLYRQKL